MVTASSGDLVARAAAGTVASMEQKMLPAQVSTHSSMFTDHSPAAAAFRNLTLRVNSTSEPQAPARLEDSDCDDQEQGRLFADELWASDDDMVDGLTDAGGEDGSYELDENQGALWAGLPLGMFDTAVLDGGFVDTFDSSW